MEMWNVKLSYVFIMIFLCLPCLLTKKPKEKPDWAKKDILAFSDTDMERLLDQWEEDDEPLPDDELPEYKRPPSHAPGFDINNIGSMSPDQIMKLTKKGKTVMMFVNVDGNPTREECESLSSLWQGALRNDHIQAERYVIDDARAIFMFHDGAQAWDAKDFLIEQDRVKDVTLENQVHQGKKSKAAPEGQSAGKTNSKKKSEL